MKIRILTSITTTTILGAALAASLVRAQEQGSKLPPASRTYTLHMLPGLGGLSGAFSMNDLGWAAGVSEPLGDAYDRAFVWRDGQATDLGSLGGYNSAIPYPNKNNSGWLVGESETSDNDPYQENFCGFICSSSTGNCLPFNQVCKGFLWRPGKEDLIPLPPLPGGNNSNAFGVNNRGQMVGAAETGVQDPSCAAPQVFDFEGVVWSLGRNGAAFVSQRLAPIAGDAVSAAVGVNQAGDIVGASGPCAPLGLSIGTHAVLWKHGRAIDLGSLGGVTNNLATAINNVGQIVGSSDLPGDNVTHGFLWERGAMKDIGTLRADDTLAIPESINDTGEIVGFSCGPVDCRGFHWQAGVMTDLNSVLATDSPLLITNAGDINSSGEIAFQAWDQDVGDSVAGVLKPSCTDDEALPGAKGSDGMKRKIILPKNTVKQMLHRWPVSGYTPER